jgi:hypothetical protein
VPFHTPVPDYRPSFRGSQFWSEEDETVSQPVPALSANRASAHATSALSHDPNPDQWSATQAADDTLAAMYIRMWSLATGRRVTPGVRPEDLTVPELVDFWADDFSRVSGRHTALDAGAAEGAL